MAPAPPTRRRSDRPRVDSQQETGNPGRSNQRREGGQAPLRPVYRHRCCPNARRDARMQEQQKTSNQDRPKHHTKTPTEPRPHPGNQTPTTTQRERRKKRKKKTQERERDLGVGVGDDVRIEVGDRGQDEETQGETQTRNGFGFPQHLREKKKRENVVGDHTKQTKKERGQSNIWAKKGQVLKGTKTNMIPTPETKNAIQTNRTNNPKTLNKKPITSQTKSRRN